MILLYRRHGANLGAAPGIAKQAWLVRCKAFHSPENMPAQRKVARRGWRAHQRYVIGERYDRAHEHWQSRNIVPALAELMRVPVSVSPRARLSKAQARCPLQVMG